MIKELNLIICGVGGQGSILVERIIGLSAIKKGYQVRAADTFGASQRGGSVLSHLRLGYQVHSCLIPSGKCDVVISLEALEGARGSSKYLRKDGLVILNKHPILPAKVKTGELSYPSFDLIIASIRQLTANIICLDAFEIAKKSGNERSINIVMLGTLIGSGATPLDAHVVRETMSEVMGFKVGQSNVKAFNAGFELGVQIKNKEVERHVRRKQSKS